MRPWSGDGDPRSRPKITFTIDYAPCFMWDSRPRLFCTGTVEGGCPTSDQSCKTYFGTAPKITKRGYHRDPIASSKSQNVVASGLRWMVLALVVHVPWNRHHWALPFLSRIAPSAKVDATQK